MNFRQMQKFPVPLTSNFWQSITRNLNKTKQVSEELIRKLSTLHPTYNLTEEVCALNCSPAIRKQINRETSITPKKLCNGNKRFSNYSPLQPPKRISSKIRRELRTVRNYKKNTKGAIGSRVNSAKSFGRKKGSSRNRRHRKHRYRGVQKFVFDSTDVPIDQRLLPSTNIFGDLRKQYPTKSRKSLCNILLKKLNTNIAQQSTQTKLDEKPGSLDLSIKSRHSHHQQPEMKLSTKSVNQKTFSILNITSFQASSLNGFYQLQQARHFSSKPPRNYDSRTKSERNIKSKSELNDLTVANHSCPEPPCETDKPGLPFYYRRKPVTGQDGESVHYEIERVYISYPAKVLRKEDGKKPGKKQNPKKMNRNISVDDFVVEPERVVPTNFFVSPAKVIRKEDRKKSGKKPKEMNMRMNISEQHTLVEPGRVVSTNLYVNPDLNLYPTISEVNPKVFKKPKSNKQHVLDDIKSVDKSATDKTYLLEKYAPPNSSKIQYRRKVITESVETISEEEYMKELANADDSKSKLEFLTNEFPKNSSHSNLFQSKSKSKSKLMLPEYRRGLFTKSHEPTTRSTSKMEDTFKTTATQYVEKLRTKQVSPKRQSSPTFSKEVMSFISDLDDEPKSRVPKNHSHFRNHDIVIPETIETYYRNQLNQRRYQMAQNQNECRKVISFISGQKDEPTALSNASAKSVGGPKKFSNFRTNDIEIPENIELFYQNQLNQRRYNKNQIDQNQVISFSSDQKDEPKPISNASTCVREPNKFSNFKTNDIEIPEDVELFHQNRLNQRRYYKNQVEPNRNECEKDCAGGVIFKSVASTNISSSTTCSDGFEISEASDNNVVLKQEHHNFQNIIETKNEKPIGILDVIFPKPERNFLHYQRVLENVQKAKAEYENIFAESIGTVTVYLPKPNITAQNTDDVETILKNVEKAKDESEKSFGSVSVFCPLPDLNSQDTTTNAKTDLVDETPIMNFPPSTDQTKDVDEPSPNIINTLNDPDDKQNVVKSILCKKSPWISDQVDDLDQPTPKLSNKITIHNYKPVEKKVHNKPSNTKMIPENKRAPSVINTINTQIEKQKLPNRKINDSEEPIPVIISTLNKPTDEPKPVQDQVIKPPPPVKKEEESKEPTTPSIINTWNSPITEPVKDDTSQTPSTTKMTDETNQPIPNILNTLNSQQSVKDKILKPTTTTRIDQNKADFPIPTTTPYQTPIENVKPVESEVVKKSSSSEILQEHFEKRFYPDTDSPKTKKPEESIKRKKAFNPDDPNVKKFDSSHSESESVKINEPTESHLTPEAEPLMPSEDKPLVPIMNKFLEYPDKHKQAEEHAPKSETQHKDEMEVKTLSYTKPRNFFPISNYFNDGINKDNSTSNQFQTSPEDLSKDLTIEEINYMDEIYIAKQVFSTKHDFEKVISTELPEDSIETIALSKLNFRKRSQLKVKPKKLPHTFKHVIEENEKIAASSENSEVPKKASGTKSSKIPIIRKFESDLDWRKQQPQLNKSFKEDQRAKTYLENIQSKQQAKEEAISEIKGQKKKNFENLMSKLQSVAGIAQTQTEECEPETEQKMTEEHLEAAADDLQGLNSSQIKSEPVEDTPVSPAMLQTDSQSLISDESISEEEVQIVIKPQIEEINFKTLSEDTKPTDVVPQTEICQLSSDASKVKYEDSPTEELLTQAIPEITEVQQSKENIEGVSEIEQLINIDSSFVTNLEQEEVSASQFDAVDDPLILEDDQLSTHSESALPVQSVRAKDKESPKENPDTNKEPRPKKEEKKTTFEKLSSNLHHPSGISMLVRMALRPGSENISIDKEISKEALTKEQEFLILKSKLQPAKALPSVEDSLKKDETYKSMDSKSLPDPEKLDTSSCLPDKLRQTLLKRASLTTFTVHRTFVPGSVHRHEQVIPSIAMQIHPCGSGCKHINLTGRSCSASCASGCGGDDPCKPKKKDPCSNPCPPKKKKDPCEKKKKDPCKKEDPCKPKKDPCAKKCDGKDPCKKDDPCKPKKEDPCKPKKEDPCKPKKEDPCKKKEPKKCEENVSPKIQDPCKEDPSAKKCDGNDPCKKDDPCKPKKEDPCKKKDPCKPKKEDPCKKKEDPCKKKCESSETRTKEAFCPPKEPGTAKPKTFLPQVTAVKQGIKKCKKNRLGAKVVAQSVLQQPNPCSTDKNKPEFRPLKKAKSEPGLQKPIKKCAPKTSDPCLAEKTAVKADGCKDPCGSKKEDPCAPKKEDPCAPKKKDPCPPPKKKDPCPPPKKKDPCAPKKKDPCPPPKKKDPCAPKKKDSCPPPKKKDPCAPKKKDPCAPKKKDPCAPKKKDPCPPKKEPCTSKKICPPCPPKEEDPCKKPAEDPCKKKKDPCPPKKCGTTFEIVPCRVPADPCPKSDPCKKECKSEKPLTPAKESMQCDPCEELTQDPSSNVCPPPKPQPECCKKEEPSPKMAQTPPPEWIMKQKPSAEQIQKRAKCVPRVRSAPVCKTRKKEVPTSICKAKCHSDANKGGKDKQWKRMPKKWSPPQTECEYKPPKITRICKATPVACKLATTTTPSNVPKCTQLPEKSKLAKPKLSDDDKKKLTEKIQHLKSKQAYAAKSLPNINKIAHPEEPAYAKILNQMQKSYVDKLPAKTNCPQRPKSKCPKKSNC